MGKMVLTLKSQVHEIAIKAIAEVTPIVKEIHTETIKEVQVIKEVPVDVIREVEKRVDVPFETIKEVCTEKLVYVKSIPSWIWYLVGIETVTLIAVIAILFK